VFDWVLDSYKMKVASVIEVDKFGACLADDDYYLFRWTSDAMALQTDSKSVEGIVGNTLEAGSLVVKAVYWNSVGRTKR